MREHSRDRGRLEDILKYTQNVEQIISGVSYEQLPHTSTSASTAFWRMGCRSSLNEQTPFLPPLILQAKHDMQPL